MTGILSPKIKEDFTMLKIRATQKEIKNGCAYIIKVPFCALQNLLRVDDPCAYTAGREGWSADVYDFGLAVIVTGYAPFGNIEPPYEMLMLRLKLRW